MDVGIGLPNAVRGVGRAGIIDWARAAEEAGFSTVGTLDRLAYPSYDSLISLAAVAAVTERIRLTTDILIAPLRANTALLAKQCATLDSLSGGRLTLGLAVGGREDDYKLGGVDFKSRGNTFERQLGELTSAWKGEREVGPAPANGERPALLIGGSADAAFRRAAQYADGWTMGGGGPEIFSKSLEKLDRAWSEAEREGQPRKVALFYFALGDGAEDAASRYLGDYYAFLGDLAKAIVSSAATDAETVRQYLAAYEDAGADEVICFPASAEADQVQRLAETALS